MDGNYQPGDCPLCGGSAQYKQVRNGDRTIFDCQNTGCGKSKIHATALAKLRSGDASSDQFRQAAAALDGNQVLFIYTTKADGSVGSQVISVYDEA